MRIPLYDPDKLPITGMLSAPNPASLKYGQWSQLTNIRLGHGAVEVRSGCYKLTDTIPVGMESRGWCNVTLNGTACLIVAGRVSGSTLIYSVDLVDYTYTEITASSGQFGNTRFAADGEVIFSVVRDAIAARECLVIQNGYDYPRVWDNSAGTLAIHEPINPPNNTASQGSLLTWPVAFPVYDSGGSNSFSVTSNFTNTLRTGYWELNGTTGAITQNATWQVVIPTAKDLSLARQLILLANQDPDFAIWMQNIKIEFANNAGTYVTVYDAANQYTFIEVPDETEDYSWFGFSLDHLDRTATTMTAVKRLRITWVGSSVASGVLPLKIYLAAGSGQNVNGGSQHAISYYNSASGAESIAQYIGFIQTARLMDTGGYITYGSNQPRIIQSQLFYYDYVLTFQNTTEAERDKGVDTLRVYRKGPEQSFFSYLISVGLATYDGTSWDFTDGTNEGFSINAPTSVVDSGTNVQSSFVGSSFASVNPGTAFVGPTYNATKDLWSVDYPSGTNREFEITYDTSPNLKPDFSNHNILRVRMNYATSKWATPEVRIKQGANTNQATFWKSVPVTDGTLLNTRDNYYIIAEIPDAQRNAVEKINIKVPTVASPSGSISIWSPEGMGVWLTKDADYFPGVNTAPALDLLRYAVSYYDGSLSVETSLSPTQFISPGDQRDTGEWRTLSASVSAVAGITKVRFYRGVTAGGVTTYYRLTEVNNTGTPSYTDKLTQDEVVLLTAYQPGAASSGSIAELSVRSWTDIYPDEILNPTLEPPGIDHRIIQIASVMTSTTTRLLIGDVFDGANRLRSDVWVSQEGNPFRFRTGLRFLAPGVPDLVSATRVTIEPGEQVLATAKTVTRVVGADAIAPMSDKATYVLDSRDSYEFSKIARDNQHGILARRSVVEHQGSIYWLDTDRQLRYLGGAMADLSKGVVDDKLYAADIVLSCAVFWNDRYYIAYKRPEDEFQKTMLVFDTRLKGTSSLGAFIGEDVVGEGDIRYLLNFDHPDGRRLYYLTREGDIYWHEKSGQLTDGDTDGIEIVLRTGDLTAKEGKTLTITRMGCMVTDTTGTLTATRTYKPNGAGQSATLTFNVADSYALVWEKNLASAAGSENKNALGRNVQLEYSGSMQGGDTILGLFCEVEERDDTVGASA